MREISFSEYQSAAGETAVYPEHGLGSNMALMYLALGLTGEAGEVAEKIKKMVRDGGLLDLDAIIAELGDVLWYLSQMANELGLGLAHVAGKNIDKLQDRYERKAISGSGDFR